MRRQLSIALVAAMLVAAGGREDKSDAGTLRDTLLTLEKQSWEMVKQRDAAGLRKYATDNFLWVFADGTKVQNKDLERFLAGYELVSYALADVEAVRIDADAAALVYRITYTGGDKGKKPVKQTFLATSAFVRRDGQWKGMMYQETPIKE